MCANWIVEKYRRGNFVQERSCPVVIIYIFDYFQDSLTEVESKRGIQAYTAQHHSTAV